MKNKVKVIKQLKELPKELQGKKAPRSAARFSNYRENENEIVNRRLRYDMDVENGECDDSIQSIRDEDRRKNSPYHLAQDVPNFRNEHAYYEMKFLKQGQSETSEY